jgi:hypothetical protein
MTSTKSTNPLLEHKARLFPAEESTRKAELTRVKALCWWLTGINFVLMILHVALANSGLADSELTKIFSLEEESNLPSWFASILWFMVAATAGICYLCDRSASSDRKHSHLWLIIAAAFLFASFDEIVQLHEKLSPWLSEVFNTPFWDQSLFTVCIQSANWLLVYVPLVCLFGVIVGRFAYRRLAERKLRLLAVAGAGSIVLAFANEYAQWLIGYYLADPSTFAGMTCSQWHFASRTIEEGLENAGAILILTALLFYLQKSMQSLLK